MKNPLWFLLPLLVACQALPIPVDIPLGEMREGRISQGFGGLSLQGAKLYIPPQFFAFDPPRPSLTYGALDARLRCVILPDPPSSTSGKLGLYLAPPSPSGVCTQEATYAPSAFLTEQGFSGDGQGTPVETRIQAVLNKDQLRAVNLGQACVGLYLDVAFGDHASGATLSWTFLYLRALVGIF